MTERKFAVSEATVRSSKKWKINEYTLDELIKKLSVSVKTSETASEFRKMSKNEQLNIKDKGGMVPGRLKKEGRRNKDAVQCLSMIALDADTPEEEIIEDIKLLSDCLIIIHSTHSHTAKKPRLRFFIPLSRDVTPEEYGAVSRKVAETIGMANFDKTTFDQNRMMFFPSHPKDVKPIFEVIGDSLLSPDEILAQYEDWQDISTWPRHEGSEDPQIEIKKLGDPLEKPGLIGAFNRTYSISAAIENFLPSLYLPTNSDNRFTYSGGSTWGGLTVYDDLYAYSFHSTDPISGKSVNAYDLVRIHKFDDLDQEAKQGTPVVRLPSSKAMNELVSKDERVNRLISKEKALEAAEEFGDIRETDKIARLIEKLEKDKNFKILSSAQNLQLIMSEDPNINGKFCNDDFAHRWTITGDLPWSKYDQNQRKHWWSDFDDAGLRVYLETVYEIVGKAKVDDALQIAMNNRSVHPVREYLDSLKWDGVERVETLLVDYLGAKDERYNRMVTRKFLAACVARIYRPGIKFDYVLVSKGKQGIGKSSLVAKLAGPWFSDSLDGIGGKDSYEALQGTWIMEMGEMFITRKADIEQTKHFISKQEDIFRMPYGKRQAYYPRQCCFWGSTNEATFLRDTTGNRRYWPVDVGEQEPTKNVWEMSEEIRGQIWAEAAAIWKKGEPLYLNREEEELAREQQESHREISEIAGQVAEFVEMPITEDWYEKTIRDRKTFLEDELGETPTLKKERISPIEIWCEMLGGERKNIPRPKMNEIIGVLDNLEGWEPYKNNGGRLKFGREYGLQRAWVRDH